MARRRRRRRVRVEDEQGIRPTKQTVRKRRYDTVGLLYRRGRLDADHLRAADNIRKAVEIITQDVRYHPPSYDDQGRIPPKSGPRPTGHSTARELELQLGYSEWIATCMKRKISVGCILCIVLDDWNLREAEARYRMVPGNGLRRLRSGLEIYNEISLKLRDFVVGY